MASLNFEYGRPCYVGNKKAMFHCWNHISTGAVSGTYGLVEYEDGTVDALTYPNQIRFADFGGFKETAFRNFKTKKDDDWF